MKMRGDIRQILLCLAYILEMLFTSFIQCYTMRMQCFLVYTPLANATAQACAPECFGHSDVCCADSFNQRK